MLRKMMLAAAILAVAIPLDSPPAADDGRITLKVEEAEAGKKRSDDWTNPEQDFYVRYTIDKLPFIYVGKISDKDHPSWPASSRFKDVPGMNQRFFDLYLELWDDDSCFTCGGNPPEAFDISPQNGPPPPPEIIWDPNFPNGDFPHVQYDVCTGELQVMGIGGSSPIRVGSSYATLDGKGTTPGIPDFGAWLKISVNREPANWLPDDVQVSKVSFVQSVYDPTWIIVEKPTAMVVEIDSSYPGTLPSQPLLGQMSDGYQTRVDSRLIDIQRGHNVFYLFDGTTAPPFIPWKPISANSGAVTGRAHLQIFETVSPNAPPQLMDCANLNNDGEATALPMLRTYPPKVVYRRFDYEESLTFPPQGTPSDQELQDARAREDAFLQAAWPLASIDTDTDKAIYFTDHGGDWPFFEPASSLFQADALASASGIDRLILVVRDHWFTSNGNRHQFVAPTAVGYNLGALARRAVLTDVNAHAVASHELGHSYDQSSRWCRNPDALKTTFGAGCNEEYLHSTSAPELAPYEAKGFDVEGRVYPDGIWVNRSDPNDRWHSIDCPTGTPAPRDVCAVNFMDSSPRGASLNWIDNHMYNELIEWLRNGVDPLLLRVSGLLRLPSWFGDGVSPVPVTGELAPFHYQFMGTQDLAPAARTPNGEQFSGSGPFRIRLVTPTGVRDYRFSTHFFEDPNVPEPTGFFSLAIPWDPQIIAVELWGPLDLRTACQTAYCPGDSRPLFTMVRTPLPPGLANVRAGLDAAPAGPQPSPWVIGPGHSAVLAWDALDPDSADLRTMIILNRLDGLGHPVGGPIPMAADVQGGTFTVPHEALADEAGTFNARILVTDGINTTETTSGPLFTICNYANGGVETCNGIDDNCDGLVDNVTVPDGSSFVSLNPHPQPPGIDWSAVPGAESYDVVMGDLNALRANGFASAVLGCLADNTPGTSVQTPMAPPPGQGFWFLARPANCAGPGSFDTAGGSQAGPRDAAIAASPASCPQ